jgi:hypothetical protein
MAEYNVNISVVDINNLVLMGKVPSKWEQGDKIMTYKVVMQIIDCVDKNYLSSSVIVDAIDVLCGPSVRDRVKKSSNFSTVIFSS